MEGKIITRADAIALGLKKYFIGEPCPKGHVSHRRVSNGECCECRRVRDSKRVHDQNKSVCRVREWRVGNKEKYLLLSATIRERNRAKTRSARTKSVLVMSDSYIAQLIGVRRHDIPSELIKLKRDQLTIHRLTRQINQSIQEKQNGTE